MSFSANIPQATESPGGFPAQCQTNFGRLKTLIDRDHQFNDASQATDGYHNIIHHVAEAGTFGDGTPVVVANYGQTYTKDVSGTQHLFYKPGNILTNQAKTWFALSVGSARAFVNFSGSDGAIQSSFNVNGPNVTRVSTGVYTITFTEPMFTANYCVSISACRASGGAAKAWGCINNTDLGGGGGYAGNATTTTLSIRISSSDGSDVDAERVTVVVMGG